MNWRTRRSDRRIATTNRSLKVVMHLTGAFFLSWLYAFGAQILIPVPFSPIPVTMQSLVVLVLPLVVGWQAVTAYGFYLLQGIIGVPVFAFGLSTLARIFGPTGGYLIGMGVATVFLAFVQETVTSSRIQTVVALTMATAIVYSFGLWQLSYFVDSTVLLSAGLLPFLGGDVLKIIVATLCVPLLNYRRR